MAHDVFISHSSKDKAMADAICAGLEARGIHCWIAPRNIIAGQNYAGQIYKAITNSKAFVILLSENSADSSHVLREVEIAVEGGAVIVPFRIQEVVISDDLKYYLNKVHWLDALTPPIESHIGKLIDTLGTIIDIPDAHKPLPISTEQPIINSKEKETIKEPLKKEDKKTQAPKRPKKWIWLSTAGVIVIGFFVMLWFLKNGGILAQVPPQKTPTDFQTPTITLPSKTQTTTQTKTPVVIRTSTPSITPTSSFIEGVMLEQTICLESYVYELWYPDVVRSVQKGEHVIILGKNDSRSWLNVKNESGTYCGVLEKATSCWVEAKFVSISWSPKIPVFTPRPPPVHWYYVVMTVTKTDGSSYQESGLDDGTDYYAVWQMAIDRCKLRQTEGSTCTYVIKSKCK
jgi:hypothetical protein